MPLNHQDPYVNHKTVPSISNQLCISGSSAVLGLAGIKLTS